MASPGRLVHPSATTSLSRGWKHLVVSRYAVARHRSPIGSRNDASPMTASPCVRSHNRVHIRPQDWLSYVAGIRMKDTHYIIKQYFITWLFRVKVRHYIHLFFVASFLLHCFLVAFFVVSGRPLVSLIPGVQHCSDD